ncbi:DUF1707 domain-containing protein [Blastococcus sp. CT_GayMR19]|uniref:DUF1707 SHOCT-like domain-containing protein n=1 Tax=Blastococcus sp. CT_GayMR19 TaxID=2559608 RepID=UPI001ADD97D4|nr:DUF1707 domain-containing protein [Blastococcus sp. CT_GayMR19]
MAPLLESLATEPFPPQQEPPPRLRASDADREAAVRTLLDAIARGLLTLEEGDERVAAAYGARFRDELPRLTADLPPAAVSAPVAPGWRALALLVWLQVRTAVAGLWRRFRGGVRSRPRLAVATVALLALLSLVAATSGGGFDDDGHGGYGGHSGDGWHDHDDDHDDD